MKKRLGLTILLFLCAAVALVAAVVLFWRGTQPPQRPSPAITPPPVAAETSTPTPTPVPTADPAIADDGLPHDKLFITVERQHYADGDLQLIIPKLGVDVPVLSGTEADTLLAGIGLYDYAQLPGEGNRNVSLAGHRNGLRGGKITDDMPFYYIDTLGAGDCLYLRDDAHIYQYLWDAVEVVEPDDWGPIYSQGFSCLTLTSCTPIGVSDHRIIVRGRLAEVLPCDKDYAYPSSTEEAAE